MLRAPRITKKQKEYLISYLEENRVLLGGKVNPVDLPKINNVWKDLAAKLNLLGAPKTMKQWKDTISEMKTNVRRRARDVRYGHRGTGGGAPVKPLTDLEERILALISNLTVEGAAIEEAGAVIIPEAGPSTVSTGPLPTPTQISFEEVTVVPNIEFEVINAEQVKEPRELDETENQTPLNKKSKLRQKFGKRRPQVNRVETVIKSHDKQITMLARSNFAIAKSVNNLAKSIRLATWRK